MTLTCYIQCFRFFALANVVVNFTFYDSIVKIPGDVMDNHFRRVVTYYFLIVDVPPIAKEENELKNSIIRQDIRVEKWFEKAWSVNAKQRE